MLSLLQMTGSLLNFSAAKKFVTLDNCFITFGTKLRRHIIVIPMGTKYAPLIADLFLFFL